MPAKIQVLIYLSVVDKLRRHRSSLLISIAVGAGWAEEKRLMKKIVKTITMQESIEDGRGCSIVPEIETRNKIVCGRN